MKTTNAFSHLTLEERRIILTGITNNSTKTAIAQTIGKDKSTVGKEIKLHRVLTHKCKMPLECNNYRKCTLVVTAHSIARNTALSVVPGVIALLVLVMVAPIGLVADLINSNTALKTHKWIIAQLSLIPDKV
ncbi:MAG: helix-turn-helix domain-containing protein [Christensenellales bacterium]